MYIAEKKQLLIFGTYPYREPAPLQEALWVRGAPEPKNFYRLITLNNALHKIMKVFLD
jgi:hypothetical protein